MLAVIAILTPQFRPCSGPAQAHTSGQVGSSRAMQMMDATPDFHTLKATCIRLCNNAIMEINKDVLQVENIKAISDKGTVGYFCSCIFFRYHHFKTLIRMVGFS